VKEGIRIVRSDSLTHVWTSLNMSRAEQAGLVAWYDIEEYHFLRLGFIRY